MRRGRFLIETADALELIETVQEGAEVFQARVDRLMDRLAPHPKDIAAVLFVVSEIARSHMTVQRGGLEGELRRLRLLTMEQSESPAFTV